MTSATASARSPWMSGRNSPWGRTGAGDDSRASPTYTGEPDPIHSRLLATDARVSRSTSVRGARRGSRRTRSALGVAQRLERLARLGVGEHRRGGELEVAQ